MDYSQSIKSLLQSRIDNDDAKFYSIAMQVAAHEAKLGHGEIALELRNLIDKAKVTSSILPKTNSFFQPHNEFSDFIDTSYQKMKLTDLSALCPTITDSLNRLLKEQIQVQKIRSFGLSPRRKILLYRLEGECVSTAFAIKTASAIAGELGIPLVVVRLYDLVNKFKYSTVDKLRLVFNDLAKIRCVCLFDRLESIDSQNNIDEFLQMLKQDDSNSLLLVSINNHQALNNASNSIFDDVIEYRQTELLPIINLLKNKFALFDTTDLDWENMAFIVKTLCYSNIIKGCEEVIKEAIINGKEKIEQLDFYKQFLINRKNI